MIAARAETPSYNATAGTVAVESGLIGGQILSSGVRAYLGIPFAAAPVGALRWQPPQPAPAWQGVYPADRFGPECLQALRGWRENHYFGNQVMSEDCLYLNVWTPPSAKSGDKLPVVVWIYGGGFSIGSSSMANYSGAPLAHKGVIFVSFNYRLGPFGYLADPQLTADSPYHASGNYGFLDQIAALRWVQKNIANFGGDPSNVTIVGQSAGSMSLSVLQASPLAHGLFSRIVAMSGSALLEDTRAVRPLAQAEKSGSELEKALGVSSIEALKALPADEILNANVRTWPDVDGYVLPESPNAIFAAGKQNDAAMIMGYTKDDGIDLFSSAATADAYAERARQSFGANAEAVLRMYPASVSNWHANAMALDRDNLFGLMMWNWAHVQARTGKSPVYGYFFSRRQPILPKVRFTDKVDPRRAGVYHASDIVYWLNTLHSLNLFRKTRDWTADDRTLADKMSDVIVSFARNGNPDVDGIRFVRFDSDRPRMIELGDRIQTILWPNQKELLRLDTMGQQSARGSQ